MGGIINLKNDSYRLVSSYSGCFLERYSHIVNNWVTDSTVDSIIFKEFETLQARNEKLETALREIANREETAKIAKQALEE